MTDQKPHASPGGLAWRKSTYSGNNGGQCVEVARNLPGIVAVRDSKDRSGPVLTVSAAGWRSFTAGIKAGEPGPC